MEIYRQKYQALELKSYEYPVKFLHSKEGLGCVWNQGG
jgi:hypothetical protein